MPDLKHQLTAAGVPCDDLAPLTPTDRGDVLYFTAAGGLPAVNLWHRLRAMASATAHWPVLLGEEHEVANHRQSAELNEGTIADTFQFAETIRMPDWFDQRRKQRIDEFQEYNEGENVANALAPLGEWTTNPPNDGFSTPFDLRTRKPLPRLAIALVPTTVPWEVPAFLRYGAWNECPEPAVHCAAHRYWQREYGAEIVAATHDVIEMRVGRPPTTRDAALRLAEQQYLYCADIVEQGTNTLRVLASGLLNGSAWYFWWD